MKRIVQNAENCICMIPSQQEAHLIGRNFNYPIFQGCKYGMHKWPNIIRFFGGGLNGLQYMYIRTWAFEIRLSQNKIRSNHSNHELDGHAEYIGLISGCCKFHCSLSFKSPWEKLNIDYINMYYFFKRDRQNQQAMDIDIPDWRSMLGISWFRHHAWIVKLLARRLIYSCLFLRHWGIVGNIWGDADVWNLSSGKNNPLALPRGESNSYTYISKLHRFIIILSHGIYMVPTGLKCRYLNAFRRGGIS